MIKNGYSLVYAAAAEAFTFVPETFQEFFKQRRRWLPSAIANHFDVLQNKTHRSENTLNRTIFSNFFFKAYEWCLLASTIIGPAIFLVAMESSLFVLFQTQRYVTYIEVYLPVLLYIGVCLIFSDSVQLNVAILLCSVYGLAMLGILTGAIINIINEWLDSTVTYFFLGLLALYAFTALLHITEWKAALCGLIYYIGIPAGYVFLFIFAICNLHILSWGTRENSRLLRDKTKTGQGRRNKIKKDFNECKVDLEEKLVNDFKKLRDGKISQFRQFVCWHRTRLDLIRSLKETADTLNTSLQETTDKNPTSPRVDIESKTKDFSTSVRNLNWPLSVLSFSDKMLNWSDSVRCESYLGSETRFWIEMNQFYVGVPAEDRPKENKRKLLRPFRNRMVFYFTFINTIVVVMSSFMYFFEDQATVNITNTLSIKPLSFFVMILFVLTLLVQFICMIINKHETIIHILADTDIYKRKQKVHPHPPITTLTDNHEIGDGENKPSSSAKMGIETEKTSQDLYKYADAPENDKEETHIKAHDNNKIDNEDPQSHSDDKAESADLSRDPLFKRTSTKTFSEERHDLVETDIDLTKSLTEVATTEESTHQSNFYETSLSPTPSVSGHGSNHNAMNSNNAHTMERNESLVVYVSTLEIDDPITSREILFQDKYK